MQVESSFYLPIYFYKTKKKFLKNKNNFWDICHRDRESTTTPKETQDAGL